MRTSAPACPALEAAGIRPATPVRLARVTPLVRLGADRGARDVVAYARPGAVAPSSSPSVTPRPQDFERVTSRSYRVAELRRARKRQIAKRRLVAIATAVATCSLLVALSVGAGALRSLNQQHDAVLPGTTATTGGYLYRVQPGDTLWSIASRIVGDGDPRPVVAQLQSELQGTTLEPGAQLLVP